MKVITGIGINLADVKSERFSKFILGHRNSLRGSMFLNEQTKTLLAYLEKTPDRLVTNSGLLENSGNQGLSPFVWRAIFNETGLLVDVPGLTREGQDMVIFAKGFPWEFSARETEMSQKEVLDLLSGYASELGLTLDTEAVLIYN